MENLPFGKIVASRPFHILVGPDKKEFMVHAELLAQMSKPLNVLVSGNMKEAREGVAEWPQFDEATFFQFCEFAYTADYTSAHPTLSSSSKPEPNLFSEENPQEFPGYRSTSKKKGKKSHIFDTPLAFEDIEYSQSRSSRLWDTFKGICFEPTQARKPLKNIVHTGDMDYSEVFLAHVRLYVLADYYDIDALMVLSLQKLHQALVDFLFSAQTMDHIVALAEYAYEKTVEKGGDHDRLRTLIVRYIGCKIDQLWESEYFQDVLGRYAEFSRAIVGQVLEKPK